MTVPTIQSTSSFTNFNVYDDDYTKPSGLADDDILIAFAASDSSNCQRMEEAGWKPINTQYEFTDPAINHNGTSISIGVWWKTVPTASGEPAAYTSMGSDEEDIVGFMLRIQDADMVKPIEQVGWSTGTSNTPATPAVTTLNGECAVIHCMIHDGADHQSTQAASTPTGYTNKFHDRSRDSTSGVAMTVNELTGGKGTAGVVASEDLATDGTSEQWLCITIAIAPASGAYNVTYAAYDYGGSSWGEIPGHFWAGQTGQKGIIYGTDILTLFDRNVWLTNDPVWGDETEKVSQQNVSWTGTKVTFDTRRTDGGTETVPEGLAYLFVETLGGVRGPLPVYVDDDEPSTPDVKVKRGILTTPTSGTDVNLDTTGLGDDVKAIFLYGVDSTGETSQNGVSIFYGFSDFTNHRSCFLVSEDGVADNDGSGENSALIIGSESTGATDQIRADTASAITGGFRLHFNLTDGRAVKVHYIAFCGADVDAYVTSADINSGVPLTAPTFDVDTVFAFHNGDTTFASGTTTFSGSVGVCTVLDDQYKDYPTYEQWALGYYGGPGTGNSTRLAGLIEGVVAGDAGSSSWTWSQRMMNSLHGGHVEFGGNASDDVAYLCLKLGGPFVKRRAFVFAKGTGATEDLEDLNGTPQFILAGTARRTDKLEKDIEGTNGVAVSLGTADGTDQECVFWTLPNAANNNAQIRDEDKVILIDADAESTIDTMGSLGAFSDSTPTITWSPHTDTGAYYIGIFSVEQTSTDVICVADSLASAFSAADPTAVADSECAADSLASAFSAADPTAVADTLCEPDSLATAFAAADPTAVADSLCAPDSLASVFSAADPTAVSDSVCAPDSLVSAFAAADPTAVAESFCLADSLATAFSAADPTAVADTLATADSLASVFVAGTPRADQAHIPDSLASAFAAGTPTAVADAVCVPDSLSSVLAFGTVTAKADSICEPDSLASGFSSPDPIAIANSVCEPDSLASIFSAADPTAVADSVCEPDSLASVLAFGAVTVVADSVCTPDALATAFAAGTPTATIGEFAVADSLASAFSAGTPTAVADSVCVPDSLASVFAAGTPTAKADSLCVVDSLASAYSGGDATAVADSLCTPDSLASTFTAGTPTASAAAGEVTCVPDSLASAFSAGTPTAKADSICVPDSLASILAFGTPQATADALCVPDALPSEFGAEDATAVADALCEPDSLSTGFSASDPTALLSSDIVCVADSLASSFSAGTPTAIIVKPNRMITLSELRQFGIDDSDATRNPYAK